MKRFLHQMETRKKKIRAPDGEDQKSASFINDLPLWETRDGVEKSCLFSQATLLL